MADADELLRRADAIDAEASSASEASEERLRREAAQLRQEALAGRPYPVLVCADCFRLTGWVTDDGRCVFCEERWLRRQTAGFVPLADRRAAAAASGPAWRRTMRALGLASRTDRHEQWLARVEPDETGPVEPEDGWELEAPVKYERHRPDGIGFLVCFDAQSIRFEYAEWRNEATTRGGKPRVIGPREFAASLSMEQLAEAWADFREEVAAHNQQVWQAERDRREQARLLEQRRRDAEELERGTSGLLG